jgi:catechol 2,3-dioxygenase-like lactoylglutathione lyase family enzyme
MQISQLDHCAIRTVHLEECRRFYRDVLGLVEGPRPPFAIPGIWFYSGENPIVHITYLSEQRAPPPQPPLRSRDGGYLDHVAFRATGLLEMLERLQRHAIPVREVSIPSIQLYQLFFQDPDGVTVELDYALDEAAGRRPHASI